MTTKPRAPSGDGLGTALISLSAALGLLVGARAVVAVELPGLRSLLGKQRPYILTSRHKRDDGRNEVCYGLAPGIDTYLIERSAAEAHAAADG